MPQSNNTNTDSTIETQQEEGAIEDNKKPNSINKMNMSIDYNNETLDNNNNNDNGNAEPPQIVPSSAEDEGFIGEYTLNDDIDEEEKSRPVSSFRRRLSKKLVKTMSNSHLQKKTSSDNKNEDDSDGLALMSSGNNSRGRGRARGRSMKEALENGSANIRDTIRSKSPSVLRRLRRRDSSDSCHQLVQDDDDEHDEIMEDDLVKPGEEDGGQKPRSFLTNSTQLSAGNHDEDDDILSDGEETNYSQFQPSLNVSLRAERSMFTENNNDSLLGGDGDEKEEPMVVVVTNSGYLSGDQLDLSIRSETAETAQEPDPISPEQVRKPTSKRERGSLSRRHKDRTAAAKKKDRHSVSPKRNSSVPKSGVTRPKRHSTAGAIPKRRASVPKNAVTSKKADSAHNRSSLTNNKREKSPKRQTKSPKKERTVGKREKSPKKEKKKKVVPVVVDNPAVALET